MAQDKIEFKYKFPDDYAPVYVNGCYGGKGPRGEIAINFFSERYPVPNSETYELTEEGQLSIRTGIDPEVMPVIRTVPCGVVMSEQSAREIHAWLGRVLGLEQ